MKMVSLNILVPDDKADAVANLLCNNVRARDVPNIGTFLEGISVETTNNYGTLIKHQDSEIYQILNGIGSVYTTIEVVPGDDALLVYAVKIGKVPISKLIDAGWKSKHIRTMTANGPVEVIRKVGEPLVELKENSEI